MITPKNSDKHWEILAQTAPYYSVSIYEKFKGQSLDGKTRDEFFESGEKHLETVLGYIRNNLDRNFNPVRCLDFGCGVGRVLVPLAKKFHSIVGVDISRTMLEEAKTNCQSYGLTNVEFVQSDDELSKLDKGFDFIHSHIVFQHIARRRGENVLKRMVELLNENGVASLHFTYVSNRKLWPRFKYWVHSSIPFANNAINLLKGRNFNYPYVLINVYDLNKLFRTIQENGCEHCYVRFTNHDGLLGLMLLFQKKAVGLLW